jgi:hypothetical protein
LRDVARRVRHGDLPRDVVAEVGEAAAKPLLVRVQNAAQQKFAAGVDEFDVHAGSFGLETPAGKSRAQIIFSGAAAGFPR